MKNRILLITGGLVLFIFLVFGTYTWYLYFLEAGNNYAIDPDNTINSNLQDGKITLQDYGTGVYDSNANSIEDSEVNDVVPYRFKVVNDGKEDNYSVYIEDLPANAVGDGCTEETLLTREQLKYELRLNGTVIKSDFLSNVKDNVLDTRKITTNQTNNYELRIYIHDDAEDWTDKHYHYKVVLNHGE